MRLSSSGCGSRPGQVNCSSGLRFRVMTTPLSEVVHCKSKAEDGVWDARDNCDRRHLADLLEVAGARVVVVLGEVAAATVRVHLSFAEVNPEWNRLRKGSGGRSFLFLPHPNAWVDQQLVKTLQPALLAFVRPGLYPVFLFPNTSWVELQELRPPSFLPRPA